MSLLDCDRQILLKDRLIDRVIAHTSVYLEDSGAIVTNFQATTDIEVDLPAPPFGGAYFKFVVVAPLDLRINATNPVAPTSFIIFTDSIGTVFGLNSMTSNVSGSTLTLEAGLSDDWHVIGLTGKWELI
jgi:hypothetical protein